MEDTYNLHQLSRQEHYDAKGRQEQNLTQRRGIKKLQKKEFYIRAGKEHSKLDKEVYLEHAAKMHL